MIPNEIQQCIILDLNVVFIRDEKSTEQIDKVEPPFRSSPVAGTEDVNINA